MVSIDINSGSSKHFNSIGHARIYAIKELINLHSNKTVIYMDNDTGIRVGKGLQCMEFIDKQDQVIGYRREYWLKFNEIEPRYSYSANPINNGIIIYPVYDKRKLFVEANIQNYEKINQEVLSAYNDMQSFTKTCQDYNYNKYICNDSHECQGQTNGFIHYYLQKHYNGYDIIIDQTKRNDFNFKYLFNH